LEGRKIPWFNYQDRKRVGNISYMSVLANAIPNLIDSVENKFIRALLKFTYAPVGWFYRLRLKKKWYTYYSDLALIRRLRRKIFYERNKN